MKLSDKQKAKLKDVALRSIKTFVQAAGGYAISRLSTANIEDGDLKKVLIAIITPAAALGICAVWNGVISPMMQQPADNTQQFEIEGDDADEQD